MRVRTRIALALTAVALFTVTAVAFAANGTPTPKLTLGSGAGSLETTVSYPHSVKLTATFPSGIETGAVEAMASTLTADGWTGIWNQVATVSTSTPSTSVKPKVNTVYRIKFSETTLSNTATVSVRAQLLKPQIKGYARVGRAIAVSGMMAPAEAGTVTVTAYRMETVRVKSVTRSGKIHIKRVEKWVRHGRVVSAGTPVLRPLDYKNPQWSKWKTSWTPDAIGWWKIVVTHEDATHVASSATTYKWVRK